MGPLDIWPIKNIPTPVWPKKRVTILTPTAIAKVWVLVMIVLRSMILSVVLDRPSITAASVKPNERDILHKIVSVVCVVVLVFLRVLLVEFPCVVLACTTIVAYVRRNRFFMHPIVFPGCVVV